MPAALLFATVACTRPRNDVDDASTVQPTDTGSVGTRCPTFNTSAPEIEDVDIRCVGAKLVVEFQTDAWTNRIAYFFMQETSSDTEPQRAELHPVLFQESDECGNWERLQVELLSGGQSQGFVPTWSTVFTCQDVTVQSFSFAAFVYDLRDDFASCAVWGQDVESMVDGTHEREMDPPPMERPCSVGRPFAPPETGE